MTTELVSVPEYRTGRNFIRVGDTIKVKSDPGKRNTFMAKVKEIKAVKETGEIDHLSVINIKRQQWKTAKPEQVQRVAQSRIEEKKR